jgi:hypothetical protein
VGKACSYYSPLIYKPLPSRLRLKLGKALGSKQNPLLIQEAKVYKSTNLQIYKFVDGGDNTMFSFTTDEKG